MLSSRLHNARVPPPFYVLPYGKLKEAVENLDDPSKTCEIIFRTIGCFVLLIFGVIIPVASITIGAIYKDDCTVQPLIPVFLCVVGATLAILNILWLYKRLTTRITIEGVEVENKPLKYFVRLIQLFALAWFITGSVWVFQVYPPEYYNTHLPIYCNHVLYSCAFYILLITYGFIILAIICATGMVVF